MKKVIAATGIFLTMAAALFTGSAIPASASAKPARMESWSINDCGYYASEESWSVEDNLEDYARVKGTKHFLALRNAPAYSDSNIIGKLYNGDEVIMTDRWSGEYVRVYSPDYDCYGWVNGNYLY